MMRRANTDLLPPAIIGQKIHFIRNTRVILDADLAKLYQVTTAHLNRAVRRNRNRFPKDFMFQLSEKDLCFLRSQFGISKTSGSGGRRFLPYAFTEHGIAMLSSVLHSDRAIQVNVAIMRAFVQLRSMLATHEDLRRKIDEMEKRYDTKFQAVFATLRQMLETPIPPKRQIGFHTASQPRRTQKLGPASRSTH